MQKNSVKKSSQIRPDDFSIALRVSPAKRDMMTEHYGISKQTLYRMLSDHKYDEPSFQIFIRTAAINVYGAKVKPV